MSNYDGASKSLDNLRGIIIGGVDGFKPTDIITLGHVAGRMEHTEMMLRHEQSKNIVRDTRKGEWPEHRSPILRWSTTVKRWVTDVADDRYREVGMLWLPAPPPPTDD